jgi:TolB-like protein
MDGFMKKGINVFLLALLFLNAGLVYSQQALDFSGAIQSAAIKIEQEIGSGKKVAVLNFISTSQELSTYVIDELMDIFTNNKVVEVAERYRLDAILKERNYQTSGEVSDADIKSIGNQIGAKYIVTGQLNYDGTAYRFRIYAIDIEEGTRVASTSANIKKNDQQLAYFLGGSQDGAGPKDHRASANTDWTTRRCYIGGWVGGGTWDFAGGSTGAGGIVSFKAELDLAKYFAIDFDVGVNFNEGSIMPIAPHASIMAHVPFRFDFGLDIGLLVGIYGGVPEYFGGGGGVSLGYRIGQGEIFIEPVFMGSYTGQFSWNGRLGYKVGLGNR